MNDCEDSIKTITDDNDIIIESIRKTPTEAGSNH